MYNTFFLFWNSQLCDAMNSTYICNNIAKYNRLVHTPGLFLYLDISKMSTTVLDSKQFY